MPLPILWSLAGASGSRARGQGLGVRSVIRGLGAVDQRSFVKGQGQTPWGAVARATMVVLQLGAYPLIHFVGDKAETREGRLTCTRRETEQGLEPGRWGAAQGAPLSCAKGHPQWPVPCPQGYGKGHGDTSLQGPRVWCQRGQTPCGWVLGDGQRPWGRGRNKRMSE